MDCRSNNNPEAKRLIAKVEKAREEAEKIVGAAKKRTRIISG